MLVGPCAQGGKSYVMRSKDRDWSPGVTGSTSHQASVSTCKQNIIRTLT